VYALQYFALKALTNTNGWEISGAEVGGIDPVRGLQLRGTGDVIHITTPLFAAALSSLRSCALSGVRRNCQPRQKRS
jgi:hypothetical protein